MTPAIEDYAVIGDGRSAALVSRMGAIDWLCWPRFDSPSLFGALLDEACGQWRIAPTTACAARRAYVDGTNVLTTTFATPTGRMVVTDFMPAASEAHKRRALTAEHEIVRIVSCERGEVECEIVFTPRPRYGRVPALHDHGARGIFVAANGVMATLRSDLPLRLDGAGSARARVRMGAGETHVV